MSFILDALKKSEQERARQQAPTTLELPVSTRRRGMPLWVMLVLLLLVLNCGLLLVMALRPSGTPVADKAPATESDSGKATTPVVAATPAAPRAARAQIRSLEEEAALDSASADEAEPPTALREAATSFGVSTAAPTDTPPLVRSVPVTEAVSVTSSAPSIESPSRRVSYGGVPTLESLGGAAALNLPALRLDLHVFAAQPKERMVFINGKRYREGEQIAEGATVDAIVNDGVVLSVRGQKFLMPR